MQYTRLGSSGLQVSRIGLGMMSYGDPADEPWFLPEDAAAVLVRQAVEAGVTFFDTADMYSGGVSEEITGRLLGRFFARRDDYVLATKVFFPMGSGPNDRGLSRKHVMSAVDASLRRLGTDHIDLYQIHRWDDETPVEETMAALHDLVRAGKVRYLGASLMYAWQFAKAQHTAQAGGWTRFVSMQTRYNLVYREEEREMLPLCADQGVGVLPYSPLARGSSPGPGTLRGRLPSGRRTGAATTTTPRWWRRCGRWPPRTGAAGAGGPGVAAGPAPGQRADRRGDEAPPPGRRARGHGTGAQRRGRGHAGGPVPPARAVRLLVPPAPVSGVRGGRLVVCRRVRAALDCRIAVRCRAATSWRAGRL
ncbi:hypothetical protein GCM10027610_058210 [Dactylosporangium cerinum]